MSGERAVEVLPTHATREGLGRLADMGITAVSIGAQSFHDGVLRELRRPHDAAAARAGVENALGRFGCVDVDLIVDVEWEDNDAFRGAFLDDFRTCLSLGRGSGLDIPADALRLHTVRHSTARPSKGARSSGPGD